MMTGCSNLYHPFDCQGTRSDCGYQSVTYRSLTEESQRAVIAAMTAKIERLRAALRPFADAAETWEPQEPDDDAAMARLEHPKYGLEKHGVFTFGDLFRARAALEETP